MNQIRLSVAESKMQSQWLRLPDFQKQQVPCLGLAPITNVLVLLMQGAD